jgi:hypothetical protein
MPNSNVPEWVNDTPPDHEYDLMMFEGNDIEAQKVKLTREEYVTLKRFLAQMRGYIPRPDLLVLDRAEWSKVEEAHQSLTAVVNSKP